MEFERMVRAAAAKSPALLLESYGQHNIGIRLQREGGLHLQVSGPSGQRLGCMGMPGTTILCKGPTSDDVGYLNIGARSPSSAMPPTAPATPWPTAKSISAVRSGPAA